MVWLILIFMVNVGQIPYIDGMGKVHIVYTGILLHQVKQREITITIGIPYQKSNMILVVTAFSTLFFFFEFSHLVQRNATHLLVLQSTSIAMEPMHSWESHSSSLWPWSCFWGTTKLLWWCRLKPSQWGIQISWSFCTKMSYIGSLGCLRWRDKVDLFLNKLLAPTKSTISIYFNMVFILGWTKKSHEILTFNKTTNRTKMEVTMNNHSTTQHCRVEGGQPGNVHQDNARKTLGLMALCPRKILLKKLRVHVKMSW